MVPVKWTGHQRPLYFVIAFSSTVPYFYWYITADFILVEFQKIFRVNKSISLQNCLFGGFFHFLTDQTARIFSGAATQLLSDETSSDSPVRCWDINSRVSAVLPEFWGFFGCIGNFYEILALISGQSTSRQILTTLLINALLCTIRYKRW